MEPPLARDRLWGVLAITVSVGLISVLHYVTSLHSVVLHEIFKRLYYIPIVVAAVTYGVKGGLAMSGFASLLYVPHIVISWHAWPVVELDQYGDVLLFNLVAGVTGVLADRLRAERNRYRRATRDLEAANRELVARADERIQADRLVTVGRLAAGVAHEVRNPLSSLMGCLEILEPAVTSLRQREFLAIARHDIDRLNHVVRDFLEFARPPSATRNVNNLGDVVTSAVRLAQPNLACRDVQVETAGSNVPVFVHVDAEQLRRAILNLLLDQFAPARCGTVRVAVAIDNGIARAGIDVPGVPDAHRLVQEVFDPFPEHGNGHGLSLAIARRLIENQGGRVRARAGPDDKTLHYVIDLPLATGVTNTTTSGVEGREAAQASSA